jgi:hypothetical protein
MAGPHRAQAARFAGRIFRTVGCGGCEGAIVTEATSTGAMPMGDDRIRYMVKMRGRWRYRPSDTMRALGFQFLTFGPELTPADRQRCLDLNEEWDRLRRGLPTRSTDRYPPRSVGDAYLRALKLRAAERSAKGIAPTKEQESRDDWQRAWKHLDPVFGDVDPETVTSEQLIELRAKLAANISESEAHRCIKVWRALWKKMAVFGYCELDRDPSLVFRNSAPAPRQQVWQHREVLRLVQAAWRNGYHGLAAVIAVAWDTQLSPVDVRKLTAAQRARDDQGSVFFLDRAKTGRAAAGTLGRWSEAILDAYLRTITVVPAGDVALFWSRGSASGSEGRQWAPRPYTKDRLGEDFRVVRRIVFGENDDRQLADLRRSGAVEAIRGGAEPAKLSAKMANTLAASSRLHRTYVPVNVVTVRDVDAARQLARSSRNRTKKDQKV